MTETKKNYILEYVLFFWQNANTCPWHKKFMTVCIIPCNNLQYLKSETVGQDICI